MAARRNENENNTDKTGEVISWVIVVILMFVFPPLGVIMLLAKLGVFSNRSKSSSNAGQTQVGRSSVSNYSKDVSSDSNTTNSASYTVSTTWNDKQNRKRRNRLYKKNGRGISIALLLISIALFIGGASMIVNVLQYSAMSAFAFTAELGMGIFYILGGIVAFFARNIAPNNLSRYKNYYGMIEGRDIIPLYELAQAAGVPQKTVIRDLQAMIHKDFLQAGTYIDNGLECLVISSQAAEKMRMEIMNPDTSISPSENISELEHEAALTELREINTLIKDETISDRVKRLEELTVKIFRIVEETPQKRSQIRRFTSYYLPTTVKLVRSYATLEKQGEKGENIMSAKRSIRDILDTLSTGFEQQLDQLFKSDAIDIAADINVLENLMKQDGLKEDELMAQVSEG